MVFNRFSGYIMNLLGWKVEGELPDIPKYVIIAAPHTSAWDFFYALLFKSSMKLDMSILMKKELFIFPFGQLLRSMGGIPVERNQKHHLTDQIALEFQKKSEMVLALCPEGTRGMVREWKKGFYHIAMKSEVPVLMTYIDYSRRKIGLGPLLNPSGNIEEDMKQVRAFYSKPVGKYPAKFNKNFK